MRVDGSDAQWLNYIRWGFLKHIRGVHVVLVSFFCRPIIRSISHFFSHPPKKIVLSQRLDNFCWLSWIFSSLFLKIGHSLISRFDKKNLYDPRDGSIFFCQSKKNERFTGKFVIQETDQTTWKSLVTKVLDCLWDTIVAQVVLNFWLDMIY